MVPAASTSMLTDLYQLTMACAHWKSGTTRREACFHVFFRENPFKGGFAIAAGLQQVMEYLETLRFTEKDASYLATLKGNDGEPLFPGEFLRWLGELEFECDVDAMPEGTAVFPQEPIVRVQGPIVQAQVVETTLLNIVNFQTLVATKAARCYLAAQGDPVIEFGLRRAQGPDGALSASRAAYVGGCFGTSNVLAGQRYGIPVGGTHAHSWVMAFDTEEEAFSAYAEAMPNNATFLVDTYDTLEGVARAVEAGRQLRERGHEMIGIRIDSGDLAWLSKRARSILDDSGFPDARIYASNELDEHLIKSLKEQGARVDVWGVGTRLATAHGQPALGGIYKLASVREPGGDWQPRIKVSEQAAKITTPGVLGVRRYFSALGLAGDMIFNEEAPPAGPAEMIDPADPTRRKRFGERMAREGLLVPVFRDGARVYDPPPLPEARARALDQIELLDDTVKRFLNPQTYAVGLERGLYDLKTRLVLEARGTNGVET